MAASLSGVFNVQELTDLGALGVGMRLYTYVQGTTTHKVAYTDQAGTISHTYTSDGLGGSYIALNARGELPASLYLVTGSYDLALKTSSGATVWTRRADPMQPSESVSVKDFPYLATGDGSTNDLAAIQAAIDANPGATIVFPKGNFKVAGTITVTSDKTRLVGLGSGVSSITQSTVNVDTVVFKPTTAGSTAAFLNFPAITGMTISHNSTVAASHTSGAAVRFVQCNGYKLFDVIVNDAFEGITTEGGQLGSLKSFSIFSSLGSYAGIESALLHFRQAAYGAGLFQSCFTVQIEDFRTSATLLRGSCIRIANGDGLSFMNGYMGNGFDSLLRVKADRDVSSVAATSFTNVYFDCVATGKTLNGINIPTDGFASSNVYMLKIGAGCIIGNGDQRGIVCRKPETTELSLVGATILNMGLYAVDVEGSTTTTDLHISGANIQNCGDGTSGAVRCTTLRSFTMSGTVFSATENLVLLLGAGTIGRASLVGNVNNSNVADISNLATISSNLTIAGNSSLYLGGVLAQSWLRAAATGNLGGTVTQATDKGTGVTLGKSIGEIVMNAAALAGGATVSFTLTNNTIGANDNVICARKSGGTALAYDVKVDSIAAGSCVIAVKNNTGGSLSEAVVLQFEVRPGAVA